MDSSKGRSWLSEAPQETYTSSFELAEFYGHELHKNGHVFDKIRNRRRNRVSSGQKKRDLFLRLESFNAGHDHAARFRVTQLSPELFHEGAVPDPEQGVVEGMRVPAAVPLNQLLNNAG